MGSRGTCASSFEDTAPCASGANRCRPVLTASGIGPVLLSLRPAGGAAVRRVLPCCDQHRGKAGPAAKACRDPQSGGRRAQATGRQADSTTHMSARHILLRILTVLSLTAALLLALTGAAAGQDLRRRAQGSLGLQLHRVGDRPHRGGAPAARRLRRRASSPRRPSRRELLARSIVLASGHYGDNIKPVEIKDVPVGYRYYSVIQMAVHQGYMGLDKDGNFRPTEPVADATAETAMVKWLKQRYSSYDWTLLKSLAPTRWQPNAGWTTGAPAYLPYVVASRQLELRYNHPTGRTTSTRCSPPSPSTAPRSPTCSTARTRWPATGSSTASPRTRASPSRR